MAVNGKSFEFFYRAGKRMRNPAGVSPAGVIPFINVLGGSLATQGNAQTSQMDVS
jgi:hypothetical protein